MLQKADILKSDTPLSFDNKNDFSYFSNFLNRRMNYFLNINEEQQPKYNNNMGFSNFHVFPNNNNNITNKEIPAPTNKNKRKNKFSKESEIKSPPLLKEPEFKLINENNLEEKHNIILEENASPIHDEPMKPLFPLKGSFWEIKEKNQQNKDFFKEETLKKEEDNHEKTEIVCQEISFLAKEILRKMNENEVCTEFKNQVLLFNNKFKVINDSFLQKCQSAEENLRVFKIIEDFYNENKKITGFEAQNYKFCENFMDFMFEKTLPTINSFSKKKEVNLYFSDDKLEEESFLLNEINPIVQTSILKRILAFYLYFSKHSISESNGNFPLFLSYKKNRHIHVYDFPESARDPLQLRVLHLQHHPKRERADHGARFHHFINEGKDESEIP